MAHFALLWKAHTIEKHRQNYENEKINSILMSNADIPEKTLLQRWRHYSHDVQKRLSRKFSKWYPEGSTVSNYLVNFRAEMRFPHILLRSLFGFIGGLVLTYLCFVFIVFQLSLSIVRATILSSLFGVVVTLGLTFSNRMRCLLFLLIPQLFSRAGRYTLTCYVLVLLLTGPATNTLKNSEVLSESMACSQEQIKTSVRELNESLKKPFNSIKDYIKLMVENMKLITLKLRSVVLRVNRLILGVASLIQSSFSWLESVAESCNDQLGTPYDHCVAILQRSDTSQGCHDNTHWYHNAAHVAKIACKNLDYYEKFCVAADFAKETFYATVKRKLTTFTRRLTKILYLKIRTHHSYTFVGNSSSPSQVAAGIVTEIRSRADPILTWLSWSSCVTSLFLLLIIFRAKYYLHMFETRSRFDNRYITKEFRELDLKRLREGRDTVLPLSKRERAKYVTTTSFRLVSSEKIYLHRSAVFMMITTFKLMIHVVADYSLYWVLMTIRHQGSLQSHLQPGPLSSGAHITGNGFVSRFLQSLLDTLNIPLLSSIPSSDSCLPNPHPPNFKKYAEIGTLIVLLWLFALFEPYGLRMRHLIMGHYNSERAKTRAVWLYNHILRTRGSFMKFARRKLHREYKYTPEYDLTFRRWIGSLIPFQGLRCFLGVQLEEARCLLCTAVENTQDVNTALIRCEVPKCPGIYCMNCFSDIGQMCTICLSPTDYGDLSDVSLEKGSSDKDDDTDDKRDGDDSNNENEGNTNSADDTKKKYDISYTKYESDNDSEYSGGSDYDMYHLLLSGSKEIRNVKKYQIDSLETSKLNVNLTNYTNINTYIYYGFYRITIHDMSLIITKGRTSKLPKILRSRKVTRSRKKYKPKKLRPLVCSNNDKGNEAQKIKRDDQKNEKPECKKKSQDHTNLPDQDTSNKNAKGDKTTKSKNDSKQDIVSVHNRTNNSQKEKLQTKCSKYWNNVYNALSCSNFSDTNKNLPVTIEVKKHKVKKKQTKSRASKHNNTKRNEDARQYRISTFLADQDWKKTEMYDKIRDNSSPKVQTEVEVNNVKIPMLNLKFSSECLFIENEDSKVKPTVENISQKDSHIQIDYVPRNNFTEGALKRFFKRMSLTSVKSAHTKSKIANEKKQSRVLKIFCNSNFSMTRSMKYFCSTGNDFGLKENNESCNCDDFRNSAFDFLNTSSMSTEIFRQETYFQDAEVKPTLEDASLQTGIVIDKKTPTKEFFEVTSKQESIREDTKRQQSNGILGFGVKGPLSVLKDLYISLFTVSNSTTSQESMKNKKNTADKDVTVFPSMQSWGCQKYDDNSKAHCSRSCSDAQADQKRELNRIQPLPAKKKYHDAQVDAVHSTCTCATQHYMASRDVGTYWNQCDDYISESASDSDISQDSETVSSEKSDKSDTTVYSLAAVDYHIINQTKANATETRQSREGKVKSNRRIKVKVVTKSNQSTLTDTTKVCDVSTLTNDWWSPIIEKKELKKEIALEKKDGAKKIEKITFKNRGVTADFGRIVTFRSRAQIIPRDSHNTKENILSPSRYLLESQKYYNELFASKFYSPHLYPVSHAMKYPRSRSPINSRHQSRRGRRNKRLEESYTPRKQVTPRKRRFETSKPPDSTYQVRQRRT